MILSIVIVSFNTKALITDCLNSLYDSLHESALSNKTEVIVIDNGSTDGTVKTLKEKYKKITLIENKVNKGFGSANNQGIELSKGEYILLLNSDTVLNKDTLENSVTYIKKSPYDVIGIKLLNKDLTTQQSAGYFPSPFKVFSWMFFIDSIPLIKDLIKPYHVKNLSFYNSNQEVDWVTGAYFLAKRKVFNTNKFDPNVFMYVEEVELCKQIKKQGFKVGYFAGADCIHLKGGSSDKGNDAGILEEFKGIEYYYSKYYGMFWYSSIKLILYLGALLRLIIFGIITKGEKRKEYYKTYLKLAR